MEARALLATLYTVNSAADGPDNPDGQLTLREAIRNLTGQYSNLGADAVQVDRNFPGVDTIAFRIGNLGAAQTINLTRSLEALTRSVVIDAATQGGGGYLGIPLVTLNGAIAGTNASGFVISSSNTVIRGFSLTRFNVAGITVASGSDSKIERNYIGLAPSGGALANGFGVAITGGTQTTVGGSIATGNTISGNNGAGVLIDGSSSNVIAGNQIGTNAVGDAISANKQDGVRITGTNAPSMSNTIGGSATNQRNIISGNTGHGINLAGPNTKSNRIQGNLIGTDRNAQTSLPNGINGIFVDSSSSNTIGGQAPQNIISGNTADGILIRATLKLNGVLQGTDNVVQGNLIGIAGDGLTPLGNGGNGITISDSLNNRIGGSGTGLGNVISGNFNGLEIRTESPTASATKNLIEGNYVGTNRAGTGPVANANVGILITSAIGNTIGGVTSSAGNLISGNNSDGVLIQSSSSANVFMSNLIGLDVGAYSDPNSAKALPNRRHGIHLVNSNDNVIGASYLNGSYTGAGNFLAFNAFPNGQLGSSGVFVESGVRNAILKNSIFNNLGLGIDLAPIGPNGPAANPGNGPNNLQNGPVILSVQSELGITYLRGSLTSAPNTQYHLEFFSNPVSDPTARRSGRTFVGFHDVTTDASGKAVFADVNNPYLTFPWSLKSGELITATATASDGNTSELSAPATVNASSDMSVVLTANPSAEIGLGLTVVFEATITNTGPDTATGVVLTDVTANQTYPIGILGPGVTTKVTINVPATTLTPAGQPGITRTVQVSANELDPNTTNNQATAPNDPNGVQVINFGGQIQFGSDKYVALEPPSSQASPTFTVDVQRINGFNGQATVDYVIALADPSDAQYVPAGYLPVPGQPTVLTGTLTFADGVSSQAIQVPIFSSPTTTKDIPLTMTLSNVQDTLSSGKKAFLGSPAVAPLTIANADLPVLPVGLIQFSLGNYSAQESGGTAAVTVSRTEGSAGLVTVTVATSDGTGKAGVDYTAVTQTVTFQDGDISPKTISIPILVNPKVYGNTTVNLMLGSPTGGAGLGTPTSALLTILEDGTPPAPVPGSLQFTSSVTTVSESAGSVTLTVQRTGGSDGTVTVGYTTVPGTAVVGRDFISSQGTLTFNPGQTSQTITVPILQNSLVTGNLSFQLVLSGPSNGATLGPLNSVPVTIVNVDQDVTGPVVTDFRSLSGGSGIGGFVLQFDRAIDSQSARKLANYQVYALASNGVFTAGTAQRLSLRAAQLDPTGTTVTLTLQRSQVLNRFYQVRIVGGTGGLMGANGNLIDGNADGKAGGDFLSSLGRGTALNFVDSAGNFVALGLSRGGQMELTRSANGQGQRLSLFGIVRRRSILSGTVSRSSFSGSGRTTFASIDGSGKFGDVIFRMTTPPIVVGTVTPAGASALQAARKSV